MSPILSGKLGKEIKVIHISSWVAVVLLVLLNGCNGGSEDPTPDKNVSIEGREQAQDVGSCMQIISISGVDSSDSETSAGDPITGGGSSGSRPDLRIKSLRVLNASKQEVATLHIGQPAYCGMKIENVGNADAGFFQTRCYLSEGLKTDSSPEDLGKEDTQSLDQGNEKDEFEDFNAPQYPGWYNLMACADSAQQVTESNESNQCKKEVAFEVVSSPNLTMVSITFTNNVNVFNPGGAFHVQGVAKNLGENFGRTTRIGWFLTGGVYGTNEIFLGYDDIRRENMRSGETKSENLDAYAPQIPGWYQLVARIDYNNRIVETNESDNEIRVPLIVRGSSEDDDDLFQLLLN